jgi:hypothetical protein
MAIVASASEQDQERGHTGILVSYIFHPDKMLRAVGSWQVRIQTAFHGTDEGQARKVQDAVELVNNKAHSVRQQHHTEIEGRAAKGMPSRE